MQQTQSASKLDRESLGDYAMTVSEVAAYTGYKRGLIYLETRNGNLRAIDRGGQGDKRWRKSAVDAWLETGNSETS